MSFLFNNIFGIVVASLVILLYIKIKKRLNYFSDRGMPHVNQPWTDFTEMMSFSSFFNYPLKIYEMSRNHESPYVGFFLFPLKPALLIRDPALASVIFIKEFTSFQDHGFDIDFKLNPIAQQLFMMKGEEWRTLRHKLVPAFTSGKLRGMVPIMEESADKLIQQIKQNPSLQKDTNLKELFKRFSLSVLASTAFGIDPESINDPNCHIRTSLEEIVSPKVSTRARFAISMFFPKLVKLIGLKMFPQTTEDFIVNLTKQTIEMRKKTGEKRNDFIQLLLELKERGSVDFDVKDLEQDEQEAVASTMSGSQLTKLELTDGLLAAQVFVFLIGGFDNIAFFGSIVMYTLSKHPEIQARVREEVKQCKKQHGAIDYQALRDMKLLGACMDETLRLYPPAFVLFRQCNKPYTFSDGMKVEKGTQVMIPAQSFHLDSKYWTNPKEFNPDRFLNKEKIEPGTYLPFGDGPRICIAQRLALTVAKLLLAKLLLSFELEPSAKTKEPIKLQVVIGADTDGGFWGSFKNLEN